MIQSRLQRRQTVRSQARKRLSLLLLLALLISGSSAFAPLVQQLQQQQPVQQKLPSPTFPLWMTNKKSKRDDDDGTIGKDHRQKNGAEASRSSTSTALKRVPPELEGVPIPFVDTSSDSQSGNVLKFIECYADSLCTVEGVEYTIAVPCDYSVALCFQDADQQLIPVELADSATMDDLFPVAEAIVADEFGEELVLQRTPQTLTLVGELEEDDEDEEEDEDDDEEDDDDDGEEEVEVLLSFEHRGKEFLLVRLLDPILLVGKKPETADEEVTMDMRVLLTPEESDNVMPVLEDLFLKFHNDDYYEDDDEDDDYPEDITIE